MLIEEYRNLFEEFKAVLPFLGIIFLLLLVIFLQGKSAYATAQAETPRELPPIQLYILLTKAPTRYQVIDTRTVEQFEKGHIPIAKNISVAEFSDPRIASRIDRWKTTVIVSEDGSTEAFEALAPYFRDARHLQGGMRAWRLRGLPTVPGPAGATPTLACL